MPGQPGRPCAPLPPTLETRALAIGIPGDLWDPWEMEGSDTHLQTNVILAGNGLTTHLAEC